MKKGVKAGAHVCVCVCGSRRHILSAGVEKSAAESEAGTKKPRKRKRILAETDEEDSGALKEAAGVVDALLLVGR